MPKRRLFMWMVSVGNSATTVPGYTLGSACRKAFAELIKHKRIERQPRTTPGGGWEGVSAECLGAVSSHIRMRK